jgi:hypothetical protein
MGLNVFKKKIKFCKYNSWPLSSELGTVYMGVQPINDVVDAGNSQTKHRYL